jgi:hypothetical protein
VGEKSGIAVAKSRIADPDVRPQGHGETVADNDGRDVLIGLKLGDDVLPNGGVEVVVVAMVPGGGQAVSLVEPADPRGI